MQNESRLGTWLLAAIVLVAAGLATYAWWSRQGSRPPAPVTAAVQPPAPAAAPAPEASATPSAAAEAVEAAASLPPVAPAAPPPERDLRQQLAGLLGSAALQTLVQTQDFAPRFVATVDNLGRAQAPPLRWPVSPTPGRFTVAGAAGAEVIGADNAARYRPFVEMVTHADPARAAELYISLRPGLQQAYGQLGYPGRRFDARLLEVIDLLVSTPAIEPPVKVQITEVKGPIPSTRPWVRYEFVDPALEEMPAGRKILLRMGEDSATELKRWLRALRAELRRRGVAH